MLEKITGRELHKAGPELESPDIGLALVRPTLFNVYDLNNGILVFLRWSNLLRLRYSAILGNYHCLRLEPISISKDCISLIIFTVREACYIRDSLGNVKDNSRPKLPVALTLSHVKHAGRGLMNSHIEGSLPRNRGSLRIKESFNYQVILMFWWSLILETFSNTILSSMALVNTVSWHAAQIDKCPHYLIRLQILWDMRERVEPSRHLETAPEIPKFWNAGKLLGCIWKFCDPFGNLGICARQLLNS